MEILKMNNFETVKIIMTITTIVIVGQIFFSCNDENEKMEILPEVKFIYADGNIGITNNTVNFKTIEFYRDFIDNGSDEEKENLTKELSKNGNYFSYKMKLEKDNLIDPNESFRETELISTDDFLSSILNEDAIIAIGDYFFKIDFINENVFVINKKSSHLLINLRNEDYTNDEIWTFSTDEDVLDLLEGGSQGTINNRTMLFCRESGAASKKDASYWYYGANYDYRLDNKVVYQKAGIYFSLQAKVKNQSKGWTGLWGPRNGQLWITYYYNYKPKCKGYYYGSNSCTVCYVNSNEYNVRPYQKTRALNYYFYQAKFYNQVAGVVTSTYQISDNY